MLPQKRWLAIVGLAWLATPALAASDEIVFSIEDKYFSFSKPPEMCELNDLKSTPIIAAVSGTAGQVEVALSLCGEVQKLGLVMFSPDFGVPQEFDREGFFKGLASEYEKSDAPKYNREMQDDISRAFENETGKNVKAIGDLGYRDRDVDCVYLGGHFTIVDEKGEDRSKDVGACLTTVAGKIIFVYVYSESRTEGPSLTRRAHDAAMSVRQRNP